MGQRTGDRESRLEASPEAVRAEMAETRAALAEKLHQLKESVLGHSPTPNKRGTKTMAKKKAAAARAGRSKSASEKTKPSKASNKKTPSKKATAARSTKKAGSSPKKRRTPGMATQAKKVLGRVLAGAAAGAVEGAVGGAVEAVAPTANKAAEDLRKS